MSKKLTKRGEDYSKWYNELVVKADLAENSGVRGMMVIKPYGYAIWEKMQAELDRMFKETSTPYMPWVVVNMDDKPLGWLNSLRYILNKVPYADKDESILDVYPESVYEIK